jgi:hypothetical protein
VGIEYKQADPGTSTVLGVDEEQGIVEALVSITGVVDRQKDIIIPGAYQRTLKQLKPIGLRYHDKTRKVAKALVIEEWMPGDPRLPKTLADGVTPWPKEAGALYVKAQYNLNTKDGRDAFEDAKFFGAEGQWSIGYNPHGPNGAVRRKDGVRELRDIDLWEWSDVAHGAAPLTMTLAAKDAGPDDTATMETKDEPAEPTPTGFVTDPTEVKYDPNQPRVPAGRPDGGQWADDDDDDDDDDRSRRGGGFALPQNWLSRVLAGDTRFVEGRGGGGSSRSRRDEAAIASRNEEMDRRDAFDSAMDKERLAEKQRRLDAERRIDAAEGDEKKRLQQEERERRRQWQEAFDKVMAAERERRRQWNAEHRKRTQAQGKALSTDDQILLAGATPIVADGLDGVEVKLMEVLAGSYEETRERVEHAVEELVRDDILADLLDEYDEDDEDSEERPHWWVRIIGTYPDRAVFCVHISPDRGPSVTETYEVEYTIDSSSGVPEVRLGTPVPVEISATVIRPNTDLNDETDTEGKSYEQPDTSAVDKAALRSALNEIVDSVVLAASAGVPVPSGIEGEVKNVLDMLSEKDVEVVDGDGTGDLSTKDGGQVETMSVDELNQLLASVGRAPIA